jgi:hypothetical protein
MVDVVPGSRPASVFEKGEEALDEEDEEATRGEEGEGVEDTEGDVRSIRSVSSVLAKDRKKARADDMEKIKDRGGEEMRASLSDRLANIGVLGKKSTSALSDGTISPDPVPHPPPPHKVGPAVCGYRRS